MFIKEGENKTITTLENSIEYRKDVFMAAFLSKKHNIQKWGIKATGEDTWQDGSMPFLDILIKPVHNRTLSIRV